MAHVVNAISMSHAPGALGWPDAPEEGTRNRIDSTHRDLRERLDASKPDLIIAFLDDHFENHFRNLMPTFAIGIAPSHSGPADYMMEALRFDKKVTLPSDSAVAEHLLSELITAGFDVARMGEIEYGNNLMMPLRFLRPEFDIPVVPIYINVFSPPLPSMARAYDLGAAVRKIVDEMPGDTRIAFLATGGLSHWPPVWTSDAPVDDSFLQRMKRYQTEGKQVALEDPGLYSDLAKYEIEMAAKGQWHNQPHPLVNEQWDREVIAAFGRGDIKYLKAMTYREIEDGGGHGGQEMLNWIAVMGAMNGAPAEVLCYEPVMEWICGMGHIYYEGQPSAD